MKQIITALLVACAMCGCATKGTRLTSAAPMRPESIGLFLETEPRKGPYGAPFTVLCNVNLRTLHNTSIPVWKFPKTVFYAEQDGEFFALRRIETHSGGQSPSTQTVSILTSGDTPLSPEITEFEQSPTNGTFLLSIESDPGAHMQVESCTDLTSGSWQTNGTFTTVANTNSVFVTSSSNVRFWRIRRETGVGQ